MGKGVGVMSGASKREKMCTGCHRILPISFDEGTAVEKCPNCGGDLFLDLTITDSTYESTQEVLKWNEQLNQ